MNIRIKRIERGLRQFYLPLRDEHPKEYVKQTKAIKFIRSHTGLSDYDNIHWVYSVLHYLQIILILGTPLTLASGFFTTVNEADIYIGFFLIVMFAFCLFSYTFAIVQATRSDKIKKTNPKYSKCVVFETW